MARAKDAASKVGFAAFPDAMAGDRRCTEKHWRAMHPIAKRDRMSAVNGRGMGCLASNSTLAAEAGSMNYSMFSAALGDLIRWNYVEKLQSANGLRILRVIYKSLPDSKDVLASSKQSLLQDKPVFAAEQTDVYSPNSERSANQQLSGRVYRPLTDTFLKGKRWLGRAQLGDSLASLAAIEQAVAAGGKLGEADRSALGRMISEAADPSIAARAQMLLGDGGEVAA